MYSGVVGTEAIRLLFPITSLNKDQICAGDISKAYLYVKCQEKLYVIAREDFGEHCDKILIVYKSWYGLKTSAAAWAEHLVRSLMQVGFTPSKADPNIWMQRKGD